MCDKLEVSRSGFYAWSTRPASDYAKREQRLRRCVQEHFEESYGVYGSPRIHALLRRQGERVSRKRVARLMRELRLKARANHIYRPRSAAVACRLGIGNQARERLVTGPNQVWRGDITYLKTSGGWRYLAVVIDHYSRRLLSYQLGTQRTSDLTVAALRGAIAKRRPSRGLVFHSDRGSEYGGYLYRDRLAGSGIVQSMNRPMTMTDNAHVESFFHSLKTEAIHGRRFANVAELDGAVRSYIERYNRTRIHSSLNYQSPIDYERSNARN
jgi:transposase InsO family protein